VAAAFGIGVLERKGSRTDVLIGLFWSLGMALGILFIGIMPGYPPDLSSYLFGSILSVTRANLLLMACLTAVVTIVVAVLYQDWKAYLFDTEFAAILGVKTAFLKYLLLVLIAMSVVVLIRVVGIVLVLALMTAPAATAALLTDRLGTRMLYAVGFGAFYCVFGLWISYETNIASGASIVILSVLCYTALYLAVRIKERAGRGASGNKSM
jgi:zinc transport system permease protein